MMTFSNKSLTRVSRVNWIFNQSYSQIYQITHNRNLINRVFNLRILACLVALYQFYLHKVELSIWEILSFCSQNPMVILVFKWIHNYSTEIQRFFKSKRELKMYLHKGAFATET